MPELPEVETVLNTLRLKIEGRKILSVRVLFPKIIEGDPEEFAERLKGHTFLRFIRRGKYLLFEMEDLTLVSHLRMEGKYYILPPSAPIDKHTHVIFSLDDGSELRYHDVRKFGRMEIIEKKENYDIFKDLGPEPFSAAFDPSYCLEYFKDKKIPVKEVLLDQHFVSGIGNIYADEILFESRIHPKTKASKLNKREAEKIVENTRSILHKAIEAGGTMIRSYASSLGVTGLFQLSLSCHEQKICPVCQGEIRKIRVGGRGTYFCPNCQKQKIAIAITGTIGSGKSTVSAYIRDKGYPVFDCDAYNRELLLKGNAGYCLIKEAFPECFEGEELDKKKLSSIVFTNKKKKEKLESLLHPLIIGKMLEEKEESNIFFAEVPLLYEGGFETLFDKVILVTSKRDIALQRLEKRGVDQKEAKRRIRNQMPFKNKKDRADEIIYNNSSLEDLYQRTEECLENLLC